MAENSIGRWITLLDQLDDAVVVVDGDCRICHVSPEAETLLRTDAKSLTDRPLHSIVGDAAATALGHSTGTEHETAWKVGTHTTYLWATAQRLPVDGDERYLLLILRRTRRAAHGVAAPPVLTEGQTEPSQQVEADTWLLDQLQWLLSSAIALVPAAQRGTLLIREGETYRFVAADGWPLDELKQIALPLDDRRVLLFLGGQGVVRPLAAERGVSESGAESEPLIRLHNLVGRDTIKSSLSAPVVVESDLIGIVNLDSLDTERVFTGEDELQLHHVTEQMALILKQRLSFSGAAYQRAGRTTIAARPGLLNRLTTIINSSSDFDMVLRSVATAIGTEFHATMAFIIRDDEQIVPQRVGAIEMLWDDGSAPRDAATVEGIRVRLERPASIPPRSPYILFQTAEGGPISLPNYEIPPSYAAILHRLRVKQIAVFPLRIGNRAIGVFILGYRDRRPLPKTTLDLIATVSSYLSVTMDQAGLHTKAQRQLAQVEALHRLSMELSRSLEMEGLLGVITQSILDLVGAASATILFYDVASGSFTFGTSRTADPTVTVPRVLRPNGLTATVARERQTIVIEDVRPHPLYQDKEAKTWNLSSIIGIPLLVGQDLIGVLNVGYTTALHHFLPEEIRLLELFASTAAVVIHNARLFEQERRQKLRLEAMNATALAFMGTHDPRTIYEQALRSFADVLSADAVLLCSMTSQSAQPTLTLAHGLDPKVIFHDDGLLQFIKRHTFDRSTPTLYNHFEADYPFGPDTPAYHMITVPLGINTFGNGLLIAYRVNLQYPFTADDLQCAITIRAQVMLAAENALHFSQSLQRAEQLVAFNEVMIEVGRETDQQRTLAFILRHATALLDAKDGIVALKHGTSPNELFIAARTARSLGTDSLTSADLGALAVALRAEPLLIEQYTPTPFLAQHGIEGHVIVAPLTVRDNVLGLIVLARRSESPPFTTNDLWLVELLGKQMGVTVQKTQMVEEMQRQIQSLNQLRAIKQSISQHLDMDSLEKSLLEQASLLCGCSPVAYYSAPPSSGGDHALTLQLAQRGANPLSDSDSLELAYKAIRSGSLATYLVPETQHGPLTVVALPIVYSDRPYGCILLGSYDTEPLDQHAQHIMNLFATQAAIALENARLYHRSQELQKFNENIVQWMDEGILIVTAAGRIAFANAAAQRMLQRKHSQLRTMMMADLVHLADEQLFQNHLRRHGDGENARYELRVVRPNGEVVPLMVSAKGMVKRDGSLNTILFVLTDVTERKRLERQLIQAGKLSAIGELVAGVAHELNNPLTSIMGYAQLLRMGMPDGDVAHDLDRIGSEARRASRIVRNLLVFARKSHAEKELTDINELLRNTLDMRGYYLRRSNIEIVWHLDASLPRASVDPQQMQQVFMNLVMNAEEAIKEQATHGRITVRTESVTLSGQRWLRIIIADSGVGMTDTVLANIFDPFFTTKDVGSGTGLGLSSCYGIVEQHGGTIEAESLLGEGSRFIITLPLRVSQALVDFPDPASSPAQAIPVGPARLLIADREPALNSIVSQVLRLHGHHITTVTTAQQVLSEVEKEPFDLLILDLTLSTSGTDSLYENLQASYPDQARRIIFMTSDPLPDTLRQFVQNSGHPSIEKPFRLEALFDLVQQQLTEWGEP